MVSVIVILKWRAAHPAPVTPVGKLFLPLFGVEWNRPIFRLGCPVAVHDVSPHFAPAFWSAGNPRSNVAILGIVRALICLKPFSVLKIMSVIFGLNARLADVREAILISLIYPKPIQRQQDSTVRAPFHAAFSFLSRSAIAIRTDSRMSSSSSGYLAARSRAKAFSSSGVLPRPT